MMVVCIVQARMGSTRLPGKVLAEICGKPLLRHVVERVKMSKSIDAVMIATTKNAEEDRIETMGRDMNIPVFRGDTDDVLDRYYQCAKKIGASAVVRITGDCPLIDHLIVDQAVDYFKANVFDYVSNAYPVPSYPDGLDVEVFSFNALETAWREAKLPSEREHVTAYLWKNKLGKFALGSLTADINLADKRWTVDNEADLIFVRSIYKRLYWKNPSFGMAEVLDLLKQNPELEDINRDTKRNEGYLKSLKRDEKPV